MSSNSLPKEKVVAAKILAVLRKEYGGYWRRWPQDAFQGSGMPDIVGCMGGEFVAIELKRPHPTKTAWDRCTEKQKRRILALQAEGAVAFAASSVEEVRDTLGHIEQD